MKNLARDNIDSGKRYYDRAHFNKDHTPKKAFETLKDAQEFAEMLTAKGMDAGLEAYRCQLCGHWHLGHRYHLDTAEWMEMRHMKDAIIEHTIDELEAEVKRVETELAIIKNSINQIKKSRTR